MVFLYKFYFWEKNLKKNIISWYHNLLKHFLLTTVIVTICILFNSYKSILAYNVLRLSSCYPVKLCWQKYRITDDILYQSSTFADGPAETANIALLYHFTVFDQSFHGLWVYYISTSVCVLVLNVAGGTHAVLSDEL